MPDKMLVRGLRILGTHGVLESEHEYRQPFEVDIEVETDLAPAGASDNLEDSVSYVDVADTAVRIVENDSYALIERIATRIAEDLLELQKITAVEVTVKKLQAPMSADLAYAAVTIRRP